jgi:cytochrome c553
MPVGQKWVAVLRAAALLALLGATAVQSQTTPAAASGATAAAPPARVALCGACHGIDGNSTLPMSPSLAGQPRVFLENTLILIREGLRPIAAMKGLLDGVSDAEIVALADHYSRQPARPEAGPRDEAAWRRGEALAARNLCGTCHLPTYAGQQQMPRLAGQRRDYLAQSMREFRDNRTQGRDTQMNGVLRGYSDRDIDDLALYFAQLR